MILTVANSCTSFCCALGPLAVVRHHVKAFQAVFLTAVQPEATSGARKIEIYIYIHIYVFLFIYLFIYLYMYTHSVAGSHASMPLGFGLSSEIMGIAQTSWIDAQDAGVDFGMWHSRCNIGMLEQMLGT